MLAKFVLPLALRVCCKKRGLRSAEVIWFSKFKGGVRGWIANGLRRKFDNFLFLAKGMVGYHLGTWPTEPTACSNTGSLQGRIEYPWLLLFLRESVFFSAERQGHYTIRRRAEVSLLRKRSSAIVVSPSSLRGSSIDTTTRKHFARSFRQKALVVQKNSGGAIMCKQKNVRLVKKKSVSS